MSTMTDAIMLSPTAKECVQRLMDLIIEENRHENDHLGAYDLYDAYCAKLVKELTSEMEVVLWENYQNLRNEEAGFFDPHKAYAAGREAKLDGEMDKNIAYKFYLEKIKSDERYRQIKEVQNSVFDDLLQSLSSDSLRDKLYKVDQLYKRLYSPFEKYLWIFFHLGYDCCLA